MRFHLLTVLLLAGTALADLVPDFRPPCTPLNVVSPYQSIWSCSDTLYGSATQHWDGSTISLVGLVKVDGLIYRFLGDTSWVSETVVNPAHQTGLTVAPATTTYDFEAGGVSLRVQFISTAVNLDGDIVLASRPVTHVTFMASSMDGKAHNVQLYYDNTAEGVVQTPHEEVKFERPIDFTRGSTALTVMRVGTTAQEELRQTSDRINWGYWYLATPTDGPFLHSALGSTAMCQGAFLKGTYFNLQDSLPPAVFADEGMPVMSVAWDLGEVSVTEPQERHLTLAYDQVFSMDFFGTKMPPLWRREWKTAVAMLAETEDRRTADLAFASEFDSTVITDMTHRGGSKYATLASLVYRQAVGGTQAVHNPVTGEEWVFMKEISSDGDVSTVDVIFPAFPLFQYLYPEYFRKLMLPLLVYASNGTKPYGLDMKYNLPWAPHHLGGWPICSLSPDRQEQMPVEESANMLILLTGVYELQQELTYLEKYWAMLDGWADYIAASLPDPGNQLCTDDFEGPSPHNTNLAAKGIVGLLAYSKLVEARGDQQKASSYRFLSQAFIRNWTAAANDGDHFRMQFNLPGSWSMKYNLLFQKSLDLSGFPEVVLEREAQFYHSMMHPCGVPLDNRHPYTKTDWSMWSAVLGSQAQFEAIVDKLYLFANTTSGRVPLSDWYNTDNCAVQGFRARPVQGGLYAPMTAKATEEFHM